MFKPNACILSIVMILSPIASAVGYDSIIAIQQSEISQLKLTQVPVGGIIPIASNLKGSWQPPAPGIVKNGFMICDGSVIPPGNTLSGRVPALMDSRFLMGSSEAGTTGGSDSLPDHKHNFDLKVDTAWSGTVTGTVASSTVSANRDQGGKVGTTVQGNQGISTLTDAQYNSVQNIAGSSHNHGWVGSVSGTLTNGTVTGSVGTGPEISQAKIQPKFSTVVYIIRVR